MEKKMKISAKQITLTAAMLAICIISQFFKNTSVFITGPIVNAALIIVTVFCGLLCGVILSVITPDKEVYSCQSATFKRSLKDIATIMGDKPFSVIKTSGKTKAGRDFVNCELDIKSL